MQRLTLILSDHEKFHIGELIEKLFILQDRPINDRKKSLLAEEISRTGFPYAAIVAGLNDLMHEDFRQIKISTLVDAIRERLIFKPDDKISCNNCSNGFVVMVDADSRYFSLACRCEAGTYRRGSLHLAQWAGSPIQVWNGNTLKLWSSTTEKAGGFQRP